MLPLSRTCSTSKEIFVSCIRLCVLINNLTNREPISVKLAMKFILSAVPTRLQSVTLKVSTDGELFRSP